MRNWREWIALPEQRVCDTGPPPGGEDKRRDLSNPFTHWWDSFWMGSAGIAGGLGCSVFWSHDFWNEVLGAGVLAVAALLFSWKAWHVLKAILPRRSP
jgi:hypothetical protein